MNSDYFLYAIPGDANIIFHSITDPVTQKSCYPDMLFRHNFTEKGIVDSSMYLIAEDAIKQYGSSRTFFITYSSEDALTEFKEFLNKVYTKTVTRDNKELINKLATMLMLSATMTSSLNTLLSYYGDFVGDLEALVNKYINDYTLPVANKNEGKRIYELIRQQILCE